MADAKVRVEFDSDAVRNAVRKGGVKSLRQAGAYVRKAARHAVKKSPRASSAGTPPHTRRGLLKRSLLFGVEPRRMAVVIGPAYHFVGISMTADNRSSLAPSRVAGRIGASP